MFEKRRNNQVFGISHTVQPDSYVDRGALDEQIQKLLQRSTHIALRGESKCGKSWLRQKNIKDGLTVQCRLDRGVQDLYIDALSQLGIKLTLENSTSGKITGHLKAEASLGEGLIAKVLGASVGVRTGIEGERENASKQEPVGHNVSDLRFVADLIKASGRRLIVEDFHYLTVAERTKFAFDLKALWDYGLFVVIIGVWTQSNMLIFLNPDLSGRIEEVPIYWSNDDLVRVLDKGGRALNIVFSREFAESAVKDCYGNVGILQALTLKALDTLGIIETRETETGVKDLESLQTAALQYAEQLNPLYQQFAKRVSSGIRSRKDSTGIYAYAMSVILETSDDQLLRGIGLDFIFHRANAKEPRIQKGNLRIVLEKFEQLQVDEQGRGLIISYNEASAEITVVDRQLFLYRRYSTVKWPWEELIAEAKQM